MDTVQKQDGPVSLSMGYRRHLVPMTSCFKFPFEFQDYLTRKLGFSLFFSLLMTGLEKKKSYVIYATQLLQTNFSKNTVFWKSKYGLPGYCPGCHNLTCKISANEKTNKKPPQLHHILAVMNCCFQDYFYNFKETIMKRMDMNNYRRFFLKFDGDRPFQFIYHKK